MKTDSNESPEIIVPLGKALKDARIASSLSIDEVASTLNLGPSTVVDLEEELDAILISKKYPIIYLRGYLVNYAKLVGLNTLELFVEYQQLESVKKQTLTSANLIIPRTKKRSKLLPLLIILIIVIGAFFYISQPQLFSTAKLVDGLSEFTSENTFKEGAVKKVLIQSSAESQVSEATETLETTD